LSLKVWSESTVLDLKRHMRSEWGIPVKTQRLRYSGRVMDKTKTMEYHGVKEGGEIIVEHYPYAYNIDVNLYNIGRRSISVNDDMTVSYLKALIRETFDIRQYPRLWFNGRELRNDQYLEHLNMDEDDEVRG